MRRLLAGDMRRLFRSPLYAGGMLMMVIASACFVAMQRISVYEVGLERVVLLFMSVYGVLAAMFVSLFLGEEYACGTIRNKLIAGCGRIRVFLSQCASAALGCASLYLAAVLTALCLGAPLFELRIPLARQSLAIGMGLLVSLNYASLYALLTTLLGSRSAAIAVNMMVSVLMLMLAVGISEMLMDASGGGGWRVVLEAFPTGQAILINEAVVDAPVRMALLNVFGAALSMLFGAVYFVRADIN